jgi:hypothetical protein
MAKTKLIFSNTNVRFLRNPSGKTLVVEEMEPKNGYEERGTPLPPATVARRVSATLARWRGGRCVEILNFDDDYEDEMKEKSDNFEYFKSFLNQILLKRSSK